MDKNHIKFREIYRAPANKNRSHGEEIIASQAIMEEFMSGSVPSKFESYEQKLEEARRSPNESACALCGAEVANLQPLHCTENSLLAEDCGEDYWLALRWVYPPAVMVNRKQKADPLPRRAARAAGTLADTLTVCWRPKQREHVGGRQNTANAPGREPRNAAERYEHAPRKRR